MGGESVFGPLLDERVVVEEIDPRTVQASLHPEEQAIVEGAVPTRVAQFTAGRHCAHRALARLGVPNGLPLLRTEDRAPIWPKGFVGSITHTDSWCAAAVARSSDVLAIGIDVESATPLSRSVFDRVCTEAEKERSRHAPIPRLWGKVVFSAKEAIYKCQHPLSGKFLGFHAVDLELDEQSFVATFREDAGSFRVGDTLRGHYRVTADVVATTCLVEAA